MTTNRMGLTPEQLANSFTDEQLESLAYGNNPTSNAWRELLAYREASKEPSLSVQFKDGWPIPELVGLIVGAEKLPDGLHDFYTAPPLQAVTVPDKIPRSVYDVIYEQCGGFVECDANAQVIWNACRAAMLNHSEQPLNMVEPVSQPYKLPMQPLDFDSRGTLRFRENHIVRKLLDFSTAHGYGLNEMALEDFTPDDRMQLAQLIGYSLTGYGELSYVTDESYDRAEEAAPQPERHHK